MAFLDSILNTIFPVRCVSCHKQNEYLCTPCLSMCPSSSPVDTCWIFSVFEYRHPAIKNAIGLIKYKGKKKILQTFAEPLYGKMLEEIADLKLLENFISPILIPIPLSRKRLRKRGFNQSEILCKELMKLDKDKIFNFDPNILVKQKETNHQAHTKSKAERMINLEGSFSVAHPISGRNIILIDDVLTTGATLSEAKKALEESGAKRVIAFTIAH